MVLVVLFVGCASMRSASTNMTPYANNRAASVAGLIDPNCMEKLDHWYIQGSKHLGVTKLPT